MNKMVDYEEKFNEFMKAISFLNDTGGVSITNTSIEVNFYNCNESDVNSTDHFSESQLKTLENVYHYYKIVIPAVCIFGFFGNILNIFVFSKKKMCKTLDDIEYCTTIFLIALAVSDLMFCLSTFPLAFKGNKKYYTHYDFMLYYDMYSLFVINTFIMSSTLLTVCTAIMRYTAICHPFHSRQFISFRKTVVVIILVFIFSAGFNALNIWYYTKKSVDCTGVNSHVILNEDIFTDEQLRYVHKLLWAIVGNFIPLSVLLYCNIRLVKALHASQQLRLLHSRDNASCLSAHRRINITLITIIILFFVLVAPSEMTKFVILVSHKQQGYTYTLVSVVTNTLQCINFSVNFVLYYIIIAPFRKTLHEFFCALISRRGTGDSTNSQKQTCVVLTLKEQRRALL